MANLKTTLGPLKLQNPIMVASGTYGYGNEYDRIYDVDQLGAIVTKSISLRPRPGNPAPRIYETPSGMLNAIGLQNVGLDKFIEEKMPFLKTLKKTKVVVNVAGESLQEYVELAARLNDVEGVDALELNISCPNCESGGIEFGVDPKLTRQVVSRVRKKTSLPVIVKLSPNVTDVVEIAQVASEAGADVLSLINTIMGLMVDAHSWKPRIATVTGGLSGPAVKPVALRMVFQVHRALPKVPLVGIGGIMTPDDVVEFLLCGASAVELGTVNYVNPKAPVEAIHGFNSYLEQKHIASAKTLVGKIKAPKKLKFVPKTISRKK